MGGNDPRARAERWGASRMAPEGHLSPDTYRLVARSVPILCVDLIPRFASRPERPYLLISREDDAGRQGWCWVGGRVWIDESIEQAARRHLRETLGDAVMLHSRDWERPDLVVEIGRAGARGSPRDRRKHAVSLVWTVDCEGEPRALGEAAALRHFDRAGLPAEDEFAFALGPTVRQLLQIDAARRGGTPVA